MQNPSSWLYGLSWGTTPAFRVISPVINSLLGNLWGCGEYLSSKGHSFYHKDDVGYRYAKAHRTFVSYDGRAVQAAQTGSVRNLIPINPKP